VIIDTNGAIVILW